MTDPEKLEARIDHLEDQNRSLDAQLKQLIRTEKTLYRTQRALDHQIQVLEAINSFSLEASRLDSPEDILGLALGILAGPYPLEQGLALAVDPEKEELQALASLTDTQGPQPTAEQGRRIVAWAQGLDGPVIHPGQEEQTDPPAELEALLSAWHGPSPDPVRVTIPLVLRRSGLTGLLILEQPDVTGLSFHESPPDHQDLPLIRTFQGHVEAALQTQALYAETSAWAQTLEDKVKARTEELETSRLQLERYAETLERSNADLQQFAYVASHDLQEPIRMVSSYVQLLERRYADQLDEDAEAFIGYAVEGAERMQDLIRDLLAYSQVETQGEPFQAVDLNTVIDEVLTLLAPTIERTDATVDIEPLPTVQADPSQMRQLFQNLLTNALKFHAEHPPEVRVSCSETPDGWAIEVADNGIGIDEEHQDRIFVIFQRLNSRETYAGTGIGLAICKRIAERHGGTIELDSTPGQGATFTVHLPTDATPSDTPTPVAIGDLRQASNPEASLGQ